MSEEMRMQPQQQTLNQGMGQEAAQMMLQADPEIQVVLLSRLESLTPQELEALDRAIDSETAKILMKLLPELEELINQIGGAQQRAPQQGALAGM
jgi:hypothetical protein|tara:strand:+ start:4858 stop:5142 length:285 start_codon:yes stop_codon:yes gene_type:complete